MIDSTFLKELGLKDYNPGTSTGLSFSNDSNQYIYSFTPVDASLFGRGRFSHEKEIH